MSGPISKDLNERSYILQKAESIVNGDRNNQYGEPNQDFSRTAKMWGAYLGINLEAHDVAAMMVMLKVSRIRWDPEKFDSWLDLAGYAACGWDCAAEYSKRKVAFRSSQEIQAV